MELDERFTDVDYKTQKGVRAALSMSNVDPIWVDIEKYRRPFAQMLSIRTVNQASSYRYVATPALKEKYELLDKKVQTFAQEFGKLDSELREKAIKAFKVEALTNLAAIEGSKASELSIKAMVNGMYRSDDPSLGYLSGYLEALDDQAFRGVRYIDEDFIAKEFEFICQTGELTSFYRIGASNERKIRIQVGTAPEAYSDDIPDQMEALCEFASSDNLSAVLCALLSLYALYAIKPFAEHNAPMAYLLAKAVLRKEGLGEAASYLPLERLLIPTEALEDNFSTTMRTGDMTYCLFYSLSILHNAIDNALDLMVKIHRDAVAEEFNLRTKEDAKLPQPVEVSSGPTPVKEAPLKAEPTPITPVNKEAEVERIETIPAYEGERALSAPRAALSDKEVKETAKYLRESNPALSKGQCLFYASHCTMGRYYAIADYKKAIKCAYETARTSMDKLAAEGFYKKLQIKNKFVYTPIKQGDK